MSDSLQLLDPQKSRKAENVIFRGKNFKTQYYGGSNPTSFIGDVNFPLLSIFSPFYRLLRSLAVPRAPLIHAGEHQTTPISPPRPTRTQVPTTEMESGKENIILIYKGGIPPLFSGAGDYK